MIETVEAKTATNAIDSSVNDFMTLIWSMSCRRGINSLTHGDMVPVFRVECVKLPMDDVDEIRTTLEGNSDEDLEDDRDADEEDDRSDDNGEDVDVVANKLDGFDILLEERNWRRTNEE